MSKLRCDTHYQGLFRGRVHTSDGICCIFCDFILAGKTRVSQININHRLIMSLKKKESDLRIMLISNICVTRIKPTTSKMWIRERGIVCISFCFDIFYYENTKHYLFKIRQVFKDFFWYASHFVMRGMFIKYIRSPLCFWDINWSYTD